MLIKKLLFIYQELCGLFSVAAVSLVGTIGLTVAIGSIVAVLSIGFFMTLGLNYFDSYYGITNRVIQALDELVSKLNSILVEGKQLVKDASSHIANTKQAIKDTVIDYIIETGVQLIINVGLHAVNNFFDKDEEVVI